MMDIFLRKTTRFIVLGALVSFLLAPSLTEAAAVNVQTEGNATDVAPGAITVLVTEHQTGTPISILGSNVGDGTSEITLPSGWLLDTSLNLPAGCALNPTEFINRGNGIYTIRVSPSAVGSSVCRFAAGDYHYIVQVKTSSRARGIHPPRPRYEGSAIGVLILPHDFVPLGSSLFPDISLFATNPSDQFIIDSAGLSKVSYASPFKGAGTACSHAGAHLNFTNDAAPYTVDILAPADGVINRVETCLDIGTTDRYGFSLAFAKTGDNIISFQFSLEPMDGHPCSSAYGGDPNFFTPYILVSEGERVSKGQLLGRLFKTNNGSDNAHIHFHLFNENNSSFHCPNIFTPGITATFGSLFGAETCSGSPIPATFCYCPNPGEDLTGLSTCSSSVYP